MTDILRVIARLSIQTKEKVKSYQHIQQNLVLNALMHDHPHVCCHSFLEDTWIRHLLNTDALYI